MYIGASMQLRRVLWILSILFLLSVLSPDVSAESAFGEPEAKGGLIVCLDGDADTLVKLRANDSFFVHGLSTDSGKVAEMREAIKSKGLYGKITVAMYDGKTLPFADNLINQIVAGGPSRLPKEEILRVLVPGGVAVLGGARTVKPVPSEIGDWPQYLNKADNNAVAMDSVVGPPRRLQWSGDLRWARSHMAISTTVSMVTGNGRLFSIEDRAPTDNPYLPTEFAIVARDAFNGKKLWSREIKRWESITMYIKCIPTQQQRRMAVAGDVLYCTFELEGAVSAVDAATGRVLKAYEGTSPCQEVAYDQGLLYLNVGDRFPSAAYNIVKTKNADYGPSTEGEPFQGSGFKEGYDPEIKDKENPKSVIMAIDPKTGARLWTTGELNRYTAASLCIKGDHAVYQTSEGLFCIDSKTGKSVWSVKEAVENPVGHDSLTPGTLPNTVVLGGDKVFAVKGTGRSASGKKVSAEPKNNVFAYALKDGSLLWDAPAMGNYESSSDVFYVDGVLWVGGGGTPTAYDAETGKTLKTLSQEMNGPMGHDRCYRNMISRKYYINSKTGGADFLSLDDGAEFPHHWVRGGCGMGVLPANGLLYSSPYSCTCSVWSMFPGLNAYAAMPGLKKSDDPVRIPRYARLEKGPAYGKAVADKPVSPGDWPMYRYDISRGGVTKVRVPSALKRQWSFKLPANPSAAICVGDSVYVCDVDTHTLYSLGLGDGKVRWTFVADGRIDSPPTFHKGLLLFGSADGWVYGLRASDGALSWRFRDLPGRLIQVRDQLESAWPVLGSVLVVKDKLYFSAGRQSFLDGGIFLYALDPETGELLNSRAIYGPFAPGSGFPVAGKNNLAREGFRNEMLLAVNDKLFLRYRAFDLDLKDAEPEPHIMHLSGFLDRHTQHRTGWLIADGISFWQKGVVDLLVSDGEDGVSVLGFPVYHNHSYFDPRENSFKLISGKVASMFGKKGGRGRKSKQKSTSVSASSGWTTKIPITGRALVKAGETIFVAGEPMNFSAPSYKNYVDAYKGKLGGRLLAVSAADGKILAEYTLDAAPVWDSMVAAAGKLLICTRDCSIICFEGE